MRANLYVASALISCFIGSQQPPVGQTSRVLPTPVNITNALSAFEMCKHHVMFSGIVLGAAYRGDNSSASLLRVLDPKELAKPENTKAYLCFVQLSFWKPDNTADREWRIPGVTMFLLEYLKERHSDDEALQAEINSAEAYVKQQTQGYPRISHSFTIKPGVF